MTTQEFAQSIKAKYPQYQNVNDAELVKNIVAKYPQYASQVSDIPNETKKQEPQAKKDIKSGVTGFGQTIGDAIASPLVNNTLASEQAQTDELNSKIVQAIIKNKKEGKDTSRLERVYQMNTGHVLQIEDILPSANKSNKQIVGEAGSTLAAVLSGGKSAPSLAGRITQGTALGALSSTSSSLEEDNSVTQVIKDGLGGAFTGAVISGVLEGVGIVARKLGGSKIVDKATGNTYNKELQPNTKELTSQIKNDFETFGQKARDVVDEAGKPVYVGNYRTLLNTSKAEVEQQGKLLLEKVRLYPKVTAIRNEIAGDLVQKLQDQYGSLTENQIKAVQALVKKMPHKMNPEEMLNTKRLYDGLISTTDWNKIASNLDPQLSFATQVKYILRDNLRKAINEKTGDEVIQQINNRMSIGMEMRDLSASQIATRAKRKLTASGGLFYIVGKIIDDTILNPAVTTRISQSVKNLGQKTGQTAVRTLTRNTIIKEASK